MSPSDIPNISPDPMFPETSGSYTGHTEGPERPWFNPRSMMMYYIVTPN